MTHLYASDEANGESTPTQLARLEQALSVIQVGLPATAPQPEFLSAGASAALLGGEFQKIGALAAASNYEPCFASVSRSTALCPVSIRHSNRTSGQPASFPTPSRISAPSLRGRPASPVCAASLPARKSATTGPSSPPSRCAWRCSPWVTPTASTAASATASACWFAASARPLVGRISMDQAVLDVTEIPDVAPGDEVVILGDAGEARPSRLTTTQTPPEPFPGRSSRESPRASPAWPSGSEPTPTSPRCAPSEKVVKPPICGKSV